VNFSINMNFFADEGGLPEDIVLHVMDYLDNSSLLNLAKCNKRFKELLDSKKFESRFTLELKLMNEKETITIAEIEAIHQRIFSSGRKYKNLTLSYFTKAFEEGKEDLRPTAFDLLRLLGESVKEVTIDEVYNNCNIDEVAQMFIAMRNVTKYTLNDCREHWEDKVYVQQIDRRLLNGDFNFLVIVEELEINNCNQYIFNVFRSCTKLKRFAMYECYSARDGRLNEFLNRQTQLEHLKIYRNEILVNLADWLTFSFKLKSLDINIGGTMNDAFFERQNELKSLGIDFYIDVLGDAEEVEREREQFYNRIASIWRLPILKNLKIGFRFDYEEHQIGLPEIFFHDLPRNNTIRNVTVYNPIKNFELLFNSLDALKKIEIGFYRSPLDLSGWRLDDIAKIVKFVGYHLIYAPEEATEDIEEFEKIFGQLLKRGHVKDPLQQLCIGQPSWVHYQNVFQLSFKFCKNLLKSVPSLCELKLFNVNPGFPAYLAANKPNSMCKIELH